MEELQDLQRRHDDRDRVIDQRFDRMERNYTDLSRQVSVLETSVNTVKLEQNHLKDLVDARLRVIEKTLELQLSKTDQIGKDISIMTTEVEKSPMGRSLNGYVRSVQAQVDEHKDALNAITSWQNKVDGVLLILKWMGAGGLIALIAAVLRIAKIIP